MSGQMSGTPVDDPWTESLSPLRITATDRAEALPLWALIAGRLEALIQAGELPPGATVENEVALAARLGISRPTMRRALADLVDKGLLSRRAGVGTQVTSAQAVIVRRPVELTSLYDDLAASGRAPHTQVLDLEIVPADDTLAMALRIAPRSPVTAVRRLRFADGEPLALMTNHVPTSMARLDRVALEHAGLYACIAQAGGTVPATATDVIGARVANADDARVLQIFTGAPVLTMTRTAWAADGRGIEVGAHVYRADRYAFERRVARL